MNPFPLPLSSPFSQFFAAAMLAVMSVTLVCYILFFARKTRFIAARASMVGEIDWLGVRRYEYRVAGKIYSRLYFFKNGILRGDALDGRGGKGLGEPPRKFAIV